MANVKEQEAYNEEYTAVFAPRNHAFETVDIRTPASAVNLRTQFPSSASAARSFKRSTALLALVVGISVATVSFASDQLTRGIFLGIYRVTNAWLQNPDAASGANAMNLSAERNMPVALAIFVFSGTVSVTIASMMVVYIAPLGASSGIPQIKAYLNGVRVPGFLSLKTGLVKAVGIGLSAGGGLISGRQGAVGHVGAIIGAGMSQAASTQFQFRAFNSGILSTTFRALRTEEWKHNFAAIGAAIGVATTFSAPMGGWMWIYEEACTHWNWALGVLALIGCVAGVTLMSVLRYLSYGLPDGGFRQFELTEFGSLVNNGSSIGFSHFLFKDIPGYVVLGFIGGVIGSVLPFVNKRVMLLRYKHSVSPISRVGEVAIIAALSNICRILIPYLANDCRPVNADIKVVLDSVQELEFSQFNCPDGFYSPWAAVIFNPLSVVVKLTLYLPGGKETLPIAPLLVATLYYYIFILWSFGLPVPAGVFLPSFALGSLYGRILGTIVQTVFPDRTDVSIQGYAFLGVVSALSGVSRGISVSVIALEATGALDAAYGAVLVSLIAKLVADYLHTASIYAVHTELKDMPYLADVVPNPDIYYRIRVVELMSTNVIALQCQSRVDEILHVLATSNHNSYPVFGKQRVKFRQTAADSNSAHFIKGTESELSRFALTEVVATASPGKESETNRASIGEPQQVLAHCDSQYFHQLRKFTESSDSDMKEEQMTSTSENKDDQDCTNSIASTSTLRRRSTRIVVPDGASSFVATIYENGLSREVTFDDRLQTCSRLSKAGEPGKNLDETNHHPGRSTDLLDVNRRGDVVVEVAVPEFSLLGMIDRATLLALLEAASHEATGTKREKASPQNSACDIEAAIAEDEAGSATGRSKLCSGVIFPDDSSENGIGRDWIDAAWPNAHRTKVADSLLERVRSAGVGKVVMDVNDYLDPDPLLISDQATAAAAYMLFRSTGARHILVTNMRDGRIGGIITRKDILPGSLREVLGKSNR